MSRSRHVSLAAVVAILTFSFSGRATEAEAPQETMTVKQIQERYEQFLDVDVDKTSFSVDIANLPADNVFAEFVNNNRFFLLYLLTNGSHIKRATIPLTDNATAKRAYLHALRADSQFNEMFVPLLGRYLKTKNIEIADSRAGMQTDFPVAYLMAVAVRMFYPDAIRANGGIASHICSSINGFKDFEGERNIFVEAFAYSVIVEELYKPESEVLKEYRQLMSSLEKMNLSSDLATKLTRIQGIAWAEMSQNATLRKALLSEYDKRKAYMPFAINVD